MSDVERLSEERLRDWSDRALLEHILRRQEEQTMALQDLQAAVDRIATAEQAESQELANIVTSLQQATNQIGQLQQQLAAGGTITEADLQPLTDHLTQVAQNAEAATAAASAPPGPGSAAAAPTVSGVSPATANVGDQVAVSGSGFTGTTGVAIGGVAANFTVTDDSSLTAVVPDGASGSADVVVTGANGSSDANTAVTVNAPAAPGTPAPTPAAPAGGTAPERSVYTFDGDPTTIDATVWPAAPFVTSDTPPRQLYYFSGDANPGDRSGDGVGGVWHVYEAQPLATDASGVPVESATEPAEPTRAEDEPEA